MTPTTEPDEPSLWPPYGLDLNMRVDGTVVNVEVQLSAHAGIRERLLFYLCRLCTDSLARGQDYREMPRVVLVGILDFDLFSAPGFHSEFHLTEDLRQERFSDRLVLCLLELGKLKGPLDRTDMLKLWLALIRATTTEELDEIGALEVDTMSEAVGVVHDMQRDMRLRHLALQRDIAERDELQALGEAERRGIAIGEQRGIELGERRVICRMHANGLDIPAIARMTGHSESQIAALLEKG